MKIILMVLVSALLCLGSDRVFAQAEKARKPNPAMARVADVEGLPRVLLIGDSISIGYTVGVRNLLEGKANVHRPLTNCGPTTRGIESIDEWLKTGGEGKKWDVIHFNWGLHDLKYMGAGGKNLADPSGEKSHQQVPPAEYEKNLRILAEKLKATGAKVIWRNTTPVPAGSAGRVVGDSAKYNEIAAGIMKDLDIPTHDLFSLSKEKMDEIMRPANVHFTPEGSLVLAQSVVDAIMPMLGK